MAQVTVIVPFHFMLEWRFYLNRCLASIDSQTFKDYEILMLKKGRAAETQNELLSSAKGQLIKILHMDDYFTDEFALQAIVNNFDEFTYWQASACLHCDGNNVFHRHTPHYTPDIHTGNNRIGAPSVLTLRNGLGVTFDEDLDWLYDVSLYKTLYDKYGPPQILDIPTVTIGLHPGQLTHEIPGSQKIMEVELMKTRYEN